MFSGSLSGYTHKFTYSSFVVQLKIHHFLRLGIPLLFKELPQIRYQNKPQGNYFPQQIRVLGIPLPYPYR